jgi:hypothetical protein
MKILKENAVLILAFFILLLGIGLVAAMPYMLTQWTIGVPFGERTGQIGDSIGGTTAPVVGLLSAFLVFLSFYVQYKFNKQQDRRIEKIESRGLERIVYEEMKDLISLIEDFKYFDSHTGTRPPAIGQGAWEALVKDLDDHLYRNRSQQNLIWTDFPKAASIMKLYGRLEIVTDRINSLTGDSRTRMAILLRSETIALTNMVYRLVRIKVGDAGFKELQKNFEELLHDIHKL